MALVADIIGCWGGVPNSSSLPTFLPLLSSILRFHWYLGLEEERPTLFFFFFFCFPFWALLHQLISQENLPKIVLPPGLATTKLWVPGLLAIADLRPLMETNWGHLDLAQLQLPYILRLSTFPSATLLSFLTPASPLPLLSRFKIPWYK